YGKKSKHIRKSSISARIPLQSPPKGGDSFPSGEAIAPAALATLNYNLQEKTSKSCGLEV
ncbi:MAG: hypothetical protein UHS47_06830, partial [Oscillospiraceae bacterium]|nr:hypothetical protein [Oscillospiraceae bacterium]